MTPPTSLACVVSQVGDREWWCDTHKRDAEDCSVASVACECCQTPLPPGTPAKIDRESGVIICNECFEALTNV